MGDYRKTVTLDQNGEANRPAPRSPMSADTVSRTVLPTRHCIPRTDPLWHTCRASTDSSCSQSDTDVLLEPQLQETVIETIRLKFKSDAPLTVLRAHCGAISTTSSPSGLDASGEIELPLKAATPGDYLLSIDSRLTDDYYIPSQSFRLEGTDHTMTVKAQKIEKQTVKLKFTDPLGILRGGRHCPDFDCLHKKRVYARCGRNSFRGGVC